MPIGKIKRGKLFISGGGDAYQTKKLDLGFSELIDGKKVMYIPVAMDRDMIGYEACFDWITNCFASFEYKKDIPIIDMFLDSILIRENIDKYDAVYIGGGNTFKLLDFICKDNLQNIFVNFLNSGKAIYGGSAGAIIFGNNINTVEEENDNNYKYYLGLNIFFGFSILCHYSKNRESKIGDILKKVKTKVLALAEETGIIFDGESLEIINEAFLFGGSKKRIYKDVIIKISDLNSQYE